MDTTPQKNEPRPSMVAVPVPKPALPKHLADEPTVTMLFPRALSLNLDEYMGLVHFGAGLQEVPVSLATGWNNKAGEPGMHWYLLQQGVKAYEKPPQAKQDPALLAAQLKEAGYKVEPPTEPTTEVELAGMTKKELAAYASAQHGLALEDRMTRDQMVAAIEERRAA